MDYDAIIIGATAEGLTAAITAAGIGMKAAVVDLNGSLLSRSSPPGPVVLTLLYDTLMDIRAAHRVLGRDHTTRALRRLFSRTFSAQRHAAVRSYHAEMRRELTAGGVTILRGIARIRAATEVEIEGRTVYRAPLLLVAAGSRPRRPPRFPFDDRAVCDTDSVLAQNGVPRNLTVVGADLIGCEFSCMFAALGAQVTLVDRRNRLLRFVDADLREALHAWMQRSGVTVVLGENVDGLELMASNGGPYASVRLGSGRVEVSERVLIAAGCEPNSEDLGLKHAAVETDSRGFVRTDDRFETSVVGIYAAGAIVDGLASTTMRIHQGRLAMLCAAGVGGSEDDSTPMVINTVPEIATVGFSEEACGMLDIPHVVGSSELGRSLRWKIRGDDVGLMKLVVGVGNRRILGVHVIGTSAAEVVGLGAALLRRGGTIDEIAGIAFSPQSLSEAYQRAALDALAKLGRPPSQRDRDATPPTRF